MTGSKLNSVPRTILNLFFGGNKKKEVKELDKQIKVKDQEVKETSSWTFREWKPGERIGYPGAVTESNSGKVYQWETISGEEPGTYIGKYTLSGEAIKRNKGESPMNGKVEGTDAQDVLKQAQAAAEAELMKK